MKKTIGETWYEGYLLLDSGLKLEFRETEGDVDSMISSLYDDGCATWERGDVVMIKKPNGGYLNILTDKIVGWNIDSYQD